MRGRALQKVRFAEPIRNEARNGCSSVKSNPARAGTPLTVTRSRDLSFFRLISLLDLRDIPLRNEPAPLGVPMATHTCSGSLCAIPGCAVTT